MNASTTSKSTSEAARQAVIDSLARSERKLKASPEVKQLDETCTRRHTFRSVRLMMFV